MEKIVKKYDVEHQTDGRSAVVCASHVCMCIYFQSTVAHRGNHHLSPWAPSRSCKEVAKYQSRTRDERDLIVDRSERELYVFAFEEPSRISDAICDFVVDDVAVGVGG